MRRTDHRPANSSAAPMKTAVWLDTAGAGLRSAHTSPLQSALVHCRLSLQESPSLRLWGVGVTVGVGVCVFVGVIVGVAVPVGVAVGCTHVPGQTSSAAPPSPPPSQTRGGMQALVLLRSQTRPELQAWMSSRQHRPPGKPQLLVALARPAVSRSATNSTSRTRFTTGRILQKGGRINLHQPAHDRRSVQGPQRRGCARPSLSKSLSFSVSLCLCGETPTSARSKACPGRFERTPGSVAPNPDGLR